MYFKFILKYEDSGVEQFWFSSSYTHFGVFEHLQQICQGVIHNIIFSFPYKSPEKVNTDHCRAKHNFLRLSLWRIARFWRFEPEFQKQLTDSRVTNNATTILNIECYKVSYNKNWNNNILLTCFININNSPKTRRSHCNNNQNTEQYDRHFFCTI